ncbi:hypothetical protein Droror1_Dr00017139 [Drosera rotundifolia]
MVKRFLESSSSHSPNSANNSHFTGSFELDLGPSVLQIGCGLKVVLFVAVSVRDLVGVLGLELLDFEADLVKQLGFLETSNADSSIRTGDLDDDFGDVVEAIEVV